MSIGIIRWVDVYGRATGGICDMPKWSEKAKPWQNHVNQSFSDSKCTELMF